VLQDVGSDVFVSMRGGESLVLGVATSDGAASMVDTAIGSVCFMSWLHDRPALAVPQPCILDGRYAALHASFLIIAGSYHMYFICLTLAPKGRDCVIPTRSCAAIAIWQRPAASCGG